jgi:hypothetical protein
MTISDETLIAFADGALDPQAAAVVERALDADPQLRRRLEAQRALGALVADAFAPTLNEPVPRRLIEAARYSRPRGGPPAWAALAAALAIGVLAGAGGLWAFRPALTGGTDGMQARGALRAALNATTPHGAGGNTVRVSLSFRTADAYCRAFQVAAAAPWAGVACREADDWIIRASAPAVGSPNTAYRQAASGLPAPLMQTVEAMIVGAPLDAQAEAAAQARGWLLD